MRQFLSAGLAVLVAALANQVGDRGLGRLHAWSGPSEPAAGSRCRLRRALAAAADR